MHWKSSSADALKSVERVVGKEAHKVIDAFCTTIGIAVPHVPIPPDGEEVLLWARDGDKPPSPIKTERPHQQRKRHTWKYAEGDVGVDRSFRFRGPEGTLNLRAQNLMMFLQIAEGVDDRTWSHHLRAGDYSRWFRDVIKDDELAQEASAVEADDSLDAKLSRKHISEAVTRRYTAPASAEKA